MEENFFNYVHYKEGHIFQVPKGLSLRYSFNFIDRYHEKYSTENPYIRTTVSRCQRFLNHGHLTKKVSA